MANWKNKNGVSWDADDLISSKQALKIMLVNNIDIDNIYDCNFGNLDVDSVIEEFENAQAGVLE